MTTKTYRLFLASSNELSYERTAFVAFIHDYNKELEKYNIKLQVEWWEDMDDRFNTSNKQDDYDVYLRKCHFVIMLFWTKVGMFTQREFSLARDLQMANNSGQNSNLNPPYVYCYEKLCSADEEQPSKRD